jgi:His/Glu/Gln/Arg/opine family amino acid ABC transporter permease subunit
MIDYLSGIFTPTTIRFLANGALVTVIVTLLSGTAGLVLGLLAALGRMSRIRILKLVAGVYIEFFRGTPLLVQLFIIYFGLPSLPFVDPLPAFWAGVLGLTLYVGAYYSEIIRGAFNAVPRGQTEAAQVLGLRPIQAHRFILLPQAVRNAVPALGNQFISLIKDSTLVSVITVNELLLAGRNVISRTFEPMTVYLAIALVYLLLSNITAVAIGFIERHYNRPYAGSK